MRVADLEEQNRQKWAAAQIAMKRANLLKLLHIVLTPKYTFATKKAQKARTGTPSNVKKGSLSENVLKEDERVLFQPFHAGLHNMREPGNLVPRNFFPPGTFFSKDAKK